MIRGRRRVAAAAVLPLAFLLACSDGEAPPGVEVEVGPDPQAVAQAEADPAYQAHRERFVALYRSGKRSAALAAAMAALEAAPVVEEPYTWVSRLHSDLGRDEQGLTYFQRLAEQYPELSHPWFYKGFHEWHLGRLQEALASFERVSQIDPANPRGFYRQGVVLHRLGDFPRAVEVVKQALELDPASTKSTVLLAEVLRYTGDYEDAEAAVEHGLVQAPDTAELHYLLGQLKLRRDDVEGAEAALRRAIELESSHMEAHRELARLLFRSDRGEEARRINATADRIDDYLRGRKQLGTVILSGGNPQATLLLAELELTEGRTREALILYRRVEEERGADARTLAGMAEAHFHGGDAQLGAAALARVEGGDPGRLALARGTASLVAGDMDAATALADEAADRGPAEREFLRRVADLYRGAGHARRADELLEQAAAAPPSFVDIGD